MGTSDAERRVEEGAEPSEMSLACQSVLLRMQMTRFFTLRVHPER